MTIVRPCTADDLEQVSTLFVRVFHKNPLTSVTKLTGYFATLYTSNPWRDPAIPSLVVDDGRGGVIGFLGVLVMPLALGGRQLRVAVGGNLMVDPDRGDPLAAVRLLRQFLAGPQDLSMTDTANQTAVGLWTRLGGALARFHSIRWLLLVRPVTLGIAAGLRMSVGARVAPWLGRPFDALAVRRLERHLDGQGSPGRLVDIDVDTLSEFLRGLHDQAVLVPGDDVAWFRWLMTMAADKQQFGAMRVQAMVHLASDAPQAVVVWYPNGGGIGQVALMAAQRRRHGDLVATLVEAAKDEGSLALMGRGDPFLMHDLGLRPTVYVQRNECLMVHARDRSLVEPIVAGEVSISRLFGEWWTRLQGDSFV